MRSAGGRVPRPHPGNRAARRGRRLAARCRGALLAVALLSVSLLAGSAAHADAGPSRAEIYQALGLSDQPADYVVLVDTSGSMADDGRYSTVRSTLRSFLDGLSPRDHIALITFDSRPEPRYIGPAENADRIISRLPKAPDPRGETDIGAALDSALRELERGDAAEIASVVLLTDGEHHPPRGSGYPKSSGAPWNALRQRAHAIDQRAELAGYALPLGSGASGAELLGDVVDDTTVLRPDSIQDLDAYLERAGDGTRARKARLLLADDIGKGITASWTERGRRDVTDGSATASVTLRSTSRHTPLTVTGLRVSADGTPLRLSGLPTRLTLAPGTSKTYSVRLRGTLPAGGVPYRHAEETDATLRVSGRVTSAWQRALAPDVRLKVPERVRVTGAALPLRATVGSAVLLPAAGAGLAAVLVAAWLWWRRVHRPPLRGELLVVPAFGGELPERIALSGRRASLRPRSGGRGTVHGRRRRTDRGPRVDLLIRYTPDGSADRQSDATCVPGRQAVVNGMSFTYLPEQRAEQAAPGSGRPR
ncbi:vWA domain-containing protein [Streptomyces palmae]|uniref:VWA domain-containing protein n=1 Tax=Streptomyces palmae TaxID=1701085 RepID=A0A4Z0HIY6_9ACTN|nr:vWA domain-containing protein [Streptomyces palmae]TGB17701.1 VWA domain-containing protein [Streptomyces palmae]